MKRIEWDIYLHGLMTSTNLGEFGSFVDEQADEGAEKEP
jgi:hypothetical protein